MRLRSLCWIGLLQTQYCAPAPSAVPSAGRFIASIALLLAPAVAEETCAVDASSGEEVCKSQQAEGAPHAQDTAKASDESRAIEDSSDDSEDDDSEDGDEFVDDDALTYEEYDEEIDDGRPIWWRYSIDELFEDLWNCGEIVYGYDVQEEGDQDENQDNEANPAKTPEDAKGSTEVSEAQIRFLQQQWHTIREKYVREVHLVPIVHEELKDSSSNAETGDTTTTAIHSRGRSQLVVPTRVGDAGPHKGRGVYATESIPKGTLVSDLDNGSTGIFKDGHSWREFAATLPRMTACNFIEWSWVQTVPPAHEGDNDLRNGLTIFVAFDESNLLNSADWDGIEANVRCGIPPSKEGGERGPCRFQYYAARDIDAGEELLIDYGEFEDLSQQGWTDIGL